MASINRLRKIRDSIQSWVWKSDELRGSHPRNALRALIRIFHIVWRESERDRISLRAAALTYTIILSLVPILALGTAVLKGLGAGDQMRQAAFRFIDQLEGPPEPPAPATQNQPEGAAPLPPEAPSAAPQPGEQATSGPAPPEKSLAAHLRRAVDQLFAYVERTNFATLGAFGIVGLILAVFSMLGSIEQALNLIWQAESDRPLGRRLMDYLAIMILMPIAVNLALATEATMRTPALRDRLRSLLPLAWLEPLLLKMVPIVAVIATFTLLYRFIPNTRVRTLPALAGGICGGLGWISAQIFYVKLQIDVARYNAIYGSFATLPMLLLWLHLGWIIFLAGTEVAFASQTWREYDWQGLRPNPAARLTLAFHITGQAMLDFQNGSVTDPLGMATRLNMPPILVKQVIDELVSGGVLRRICGPPAGCVPAVPEQRIDPAQIMKLILGCEMPPIRGAELAAEAMTAARAALAGKKILNETGNFADNGRS